MTARTIYNKLNFIRRSLASFVGLVLLSLSALGAESGMVFAPEFIAVHSSQAAAPASVKGTNPVYNLIGVKLADGRVEKDVFKMGEGVVMKSPEIVSRNGVVRWTFKHEACEIEAEWRGMSAVSVIVARTRSAR